MKEILIRPGGWTINNRKRAYTLIELIAVISMSAIIISIGSTLIISSYSNYITLKERAIRADQVDNSLIIIDRLLTGYMIKEIKATSDSNPNDGIDNNRITIEYLINHEDIDSIHNVENEKSKVIRRVLEKLIVETYIKGDKVGSATIFKDMKAFEIIKKENIYYYIIEFKSGEKIIRCI